MLGASKFALGLLAVFLLISLPIRSQETGEGSRQTQPPQPLSPSGGLSQNGVGYPQCLRCPLPQPYSTEAEMAKFQGRVVTVVLQVIIDTNGRVTNIQIVKGPGMGLEDRAVETVRAWRFKPADLKGTPIRAAVGIEVAFHPAQLKPAP
jgi:TonB family protein